MDDNEKPKAGFALVLRAGRADEIHRLIRRQVAQKRLIAGDEGTSRRLIRHPQHS